jgi:hypothetical protein
MNIRIDLPRPTFHGPPPLPTAYERTVSNRMLVGIRCDPLGHDYDAVLFDCPSCGLVHFVTVDDCPTPEQALREQRLAGVELAMV